ncbi:gamma-aminobutyric acid receptor alpha-like [Caerostris darwini]|uniref:Gamma-aminobutyric acid receptor alpha-like n=1 Tax=Caerostris darwini TaxID=1538125 RepID=A0AAV4RYD4_9ARAC|nr:gamma-aminobutyric acid receptor alpha-like [Caerostris darwini]
MRLENFPMDVQRCPLQIGSFGYSDRDIQYRWNPLRSVVIAPDMKLSMFDVTDTPTGNLTEMHRKGPFSVLVVSFHLKRHMGYFVIEVYAPCTMLVVLSWVAFWINREATADRVALASERSYICESIAERAGLKTVGKEKLKIFTFASNEASISELERKRITLKNCNSDLVITLEALATKTICASKISSPSRRMVELLQKEGFELSDSGASSGRVNILIGKDYLSAVLTGKTHRLNNCLMLYESVFGWTLKW